MTLTRFDPERYYRTNDPALSVIATRGTLSQWRHRGEGPPYVRFGNRILYEGRALNSWLDAHVVLPTNGEGASLACAGGDPPPRPGSRPKQ